MYKSLGVITMFCFIVSLCIYIYIYWHMSRRKFHWSCRLRLLMLHPCRLEWLLANQGDFDPSGLRDYIAECNKLGVIPASYFARHVHDKAFVMKHYQLGPRGAKAIAKPFEVSDVAFD